jgi:hypothetical protein
MSSLLVIPHVAYAHAGYGLNACCPVRGARRGTRPARGDGGYCTTGPTGPRWMISMRVPQGSVM